MAKAGPGPVGTVVLRPHRGRNGARLRAEAGAQAATCVRWSVLRNPHNPGAAPAWPLNTTCFRSRGGHLITMLFHCYYCYVVIATDIMYIHEI